MLILLLLALSLTLVHSFRLTITSPNMGTSWRHKKAVWVKWQVDDTTTPSFDKIDIDLYVGPGSGQLIENISFGVPWQELKAEWRVAKSLPAGCDYFVQISTPSDRSFKVRSNRFAVCGGKVVGKQNAGNQERVGSWAASLVLAVAGAHFLFW